MRLLILPLALQGRITRLVIYTLVAPACRQLELSSNSILDDAGYLDVGGDRPVGRRDRLQDLSVDGTYVDAYRRHVVGRQVGCEESGECATCTRGFRNFCDLRVKI